MLDAVVSTVPTPLRIQGIVAGRFVALFSDGSTGDFGPAPTVDTTSIQGDLAQLQAARDAHAASIAANLAAITALQGHDTTDEAALAALQAKVTADEATLASISTAITALQQAKTTDEAAIASNTSRLAAVEARPVLPAGSAAKAGQLPTVQADGSYALAAPGAGPTRLKRIYYEIFTASGTWNRDNGFAAAVSAAQQSFGLTVTADQLLAVHESVGGGASGEGAFKGSGGAGRGGQAGAVSRSDPARKADLAATIAHTVGAGGASVPGNTASSGSKYSNAGQASSWTGLTYAEGGPATFSYQGSTTSQASQRALGQPGQTSPDGYTAGAASPSNGPGAGGAGATQVPGAQNGLGGDGGTANSNNPSLRRTNKLFNSSFNSQTTPPPAASTVAGQYGVGGIGGGPNNSNGLNFPSDGQAGGLPGGGGGGGAANTNAGDVRQSGKGGDGWNTVEYYVLVA